MCSTKAGLPKRSVPSEPIYRNFSLSAELKIAISWPSALGVGPETIPGSRRDSYLSSVAERGPAEAERHRPFAELVGQPCRKTRAASRRRIGVVLTERPITIRAGRAGETSARDGRRRPFRARWCRSEAPCYLDNQNLEMLWYYLSVMAQRLLGIWRAVFAPRQSSFQRTSLPLCRAFRIRQQNQGDSELPKTLTRRQATSHSRRLALANLAGRTGVRPPIQ